MLFVICRDFRGKKNLWNKNGKQEEKQEVEENKKTLKNKVNIPQAKWEKKNEFNFA